MVLGVPPSLAVMTVPAQPAVRDGVRRHGSALLERPAETGTDRAVVGREVPAPEAHGLAAAKQDVQPFGFATLDGRDLFAVIRELQDVRRPGMPGELRIPHLVTPPAE